MSEPTWITIVPPLRCCAILAVQRRCGESASVAQMQLLADGSEHMQPFCWFCRCRVLGQEELQ